MTAAVTPLEALRRLIAVAKWPDAYWFSSEADWNEYQGELGVAEMVVRDAAASIQPEHKMISTLIDEKNKYMYALVEAEKTIAELQAQVAAPVVPVAAQPKKKQPSQNGLQVTKFHDRAAYISDMLNKRIYLSYEINMHGTFTNAAMESKFSEWKRAAMAQGDKP